MRWIASIVARAVALISLVVVVTANLRNIRRARAILLYPDGGFGHTLVAPDWLRRLHPGDRQLIFFGTIYDRRRHNPMVRDLWGAEVFVWVRIGLVFPRLGPLYDHAWSAYLFKVFHRFLAWYVPSVHCYFWKEGLVAATSRPSWLAADHLFNDRYESRYYPLMLVSPAPALHVGEAARARVARSLRDRFGSDFPLRCNFYIGHRGLSGSNDASSLNRMSPEVDSYLPAIRVLIGAGYQVLLTGDAEVSATLISEMAGGLADWRSAGVDQDAFRLFAGTEVDLHVGSLSGGSAFANVTDIATLMLNSFAPGDALPCTTVSYKWLYDADGALIGLDRLLTGAFYDHQLHGCMLVDNSPDEMAETVADFVAHLHERPYGVNPAELGLDAPWIRAANGRLSPAWLRQHASRLGAGCKRRAVG